MAGSAYAGPASAPGLVISGGGAAANLAVNGFVTLAGTYDPSVVTIGTLIAANSTTPFAQDIAGWLTVSSGSALNAGNATIVAGGITILGGGAVGSLVLGGATAGTLEVSGGGTLTAGSITEADGVIMVDGALSQLIDAGMLTLDGASEVYTPGIGADGGGLIQVGGLAVDATGGNDLVTDAASAIEVGFAGGAALGAVTVDQGMVIDAASSTGVTGNLVDNGSIDITGGTFSVTGGISGGGTLSIGAGATLVADNGVGSLITIDFTGSGGSLVVSGGMTGTIAGFATGDSIVLNVIATSATWSNGQLSILENGSSIASIALAGAYGGDSFFVSPTAIGGSSISLEPSIANTGSSAASADSESWIGASGGAWAAAANWQDLTSGAAPPTVYPGTLTPVILAGSSASTYQVITGGGRAASVAVTGLVNLSGTYSLGTLTLGKQTLANQAGLETAKDSNGALLVSTTSLVAATTLQIGTPAGVVAVGGADAPGASGLVSVTSGGSVSVTGTADVVQGTLSASGGGRVQVGGIVLAGATSRLAVDSDSAIEVGFTGGAVPGAITVDAGQSIIAEGSASLADTLVDDGSVIVDAGTLAVSGAVSGNGTFAIGAGATLAVGGAVGSGVTISVGASAALVIDPAGSVSGTITGFAAGDSIVLDGVSATSAAWSAGTLSLMNGATKLGTLDVAGSFGAGHFAVSTMAGGTEVQFLPGPAAAAPADFSGDGQSAILWQNEDGAPAIWLMNGLLPTATQQLANPGTAWHVVTTGDFTADGLADLLWQNDDGMVAIWDIDGLTPIAYGEVANPGTAWHVMATGDFNGDGKSDILFQNNDGAPAIWEISGTSIIASAQLANPGTAWHVVGTGDFNGDGKSDILWQNDDGMIAIWEMGGLTPIATGDVANPGTAWHAIATGDFNGDGKSDILFQNDNGTVAIWAMNGISILASAELGDPGSQWHVVGSGDYNGDGHADILFQNNNGTAAIWEMNGLTPIATAEVANVPLSWQTIGEGSTHFINGTQSTGTIDATMLNDDFVFTSSLSGSHIIVGFDPVHDLISLSAAQFDGFSGLTPYESSSQGSLMLSLGGGSTLTLQGVGLGVLSAKNVLFS